MITVRQKVLAYVKKIRAVSAREIARALKMSAPNVRHHLSVLCSDGRVEVVAVNNRKGRGRPEKLYSLSQAAMGDNLSALADALLAEAGSRIKLDSLAGRILDPEQFAGLPVTKRLVRLVEKLNEMHYAARWEAGADGPRLIFGHCPFANIIESHPALCKMDTAMLELSLARPIVLFPKHEGSGIGLCPFVFRVG
jgi:predicted ArsR family transcriptional regulator